MARTLKDTSLDTRAARARLKARGKPYYRTIEEGLHLGYRKPRGRKGKPAVSGKWVLRRYVGDQAYVVETIGVADDYADADGVAIINFSQAQNKARDLFKRNAHPRPVSVHIPLPSRSGTTFKTCNIAERKRMTPSSGPTPTLFPSSAPLSAISSQLKS